MRRHSRLLVTFATVAAALAVTVAAGLIATPAQAATSSPIPSDPAAKGYVGLCNEDGQNVTGGLIGTKPFIWKAVASVPPPSSYQGPGQNAVLGIFQPRAETSPDEWNGMSITAASYYKQRRTPAAQATYADQSLAEIVQDYPPEVDGLYVLRMYFGRANYGIYSTTYPATTIQVTGTSWRVVKGGTVDCSKATAVSNEQLTGVAGKKATTPHQPSTSQRTVDAVRSHVISVPAANVEAQASSDGNGGTTANSAAPGGQGSLNASPAADSSPSSSSSLSWVVWLLVGVVVLLVVALAVTLRSRRTGTSRS